MGYRSAEPQRARETEGTTYVHQVRQPFTHDHGSEGDVTRPSRGRRLSYANVTASVALFVALGGTSYAAIKLPINSVGTIQLKSKAVTKAKIAPNAVDGSKVRDGSLTGADIGGKLPAAITADQLANVQRLSAPGASDPAPANGVNTKAATASCPAGTFVVGGGASLTDQLSQLVNDSYPSSPTAWTVDILNVSPTAPAFTVYAICVPAAASS